MNTTDLIRAKLSQHLGAIHVEIEDDSHRHAGHAGRQDPLSAGGHFTVVVVSPQFVNLRPLQRHRLVYEALAEQMGSRIHALSIRALTPDQWP